MTTDIESLFEKVKKANDFIEADYGGGSILMKCYLMAYLIKLLDLQTYVEIGVYRGRSLFSVATATKHVNGLAYGIDPYVLSEALEYDLDADVQSEVTEFLEGLDFENMYRELLINREELGLSDCIRIIRDTSEKAVASFIKEDISIDMLHIDGNHDTEAVQKDVDNYFPLLNDGAVVVFDDINWESVNKVYEKIKDDFIVLYEDTYFGVLWYKEKRVSSQNDAAHLQRKLKMLSEHKALSTYGNYPVRPSVGVCVFTYNHEKYLRECLEGIVKQQGDFDLHIIISDDFSTDGNQLVIADFMKSIEGKYANVTVEIDVNPVNLGMVKNFEKAIKRFQERTYDYVAICEGDDYWIDTEKIQKHIDFMSKNPECVLSYNRLLLYFQEKGEYSVWNDLEQPEDRSMCDPKAMFQKNIIGNLSCCFYLRSVLEKTPSWFFDDFVGDWLFNINCSMHGEIGFIDNPMSVYRKHDQGIWTGSRELDNRRLMVESIDVFNQKTNYEYDADFAESRNRLTIVPPDDPPVECVDLLILDTIFPAKISGFRHQEFLSYLQEIPSTKVLTSGGDVFFGGGTETVDELVCDFKREHPDTKGKLGVLLDGNVARSIGCKLYYFTFLVIAHHFLSIVEHNKKPFIFTLYPGGGFALNNAESDSMLRRVTSSPCFRKVIVTQKITYDYLIDNDFCTEDQIEFIFGVVTPLPKLEMQYQKSQNYGINKNRLDICFVALKYTQFGQDKGYDVFIDVAKALCKKHDNVYFHVVGGFDKSVIDVSDIKDHISFYGVHESDWFDDFYKDKDIILSPNVPDGIWKGSFDGFPTGSCTEAGLRKTAIFCTDELGLNQSRFKDGEDLVIVEHDVNDIVNKIEHFINNPADLESIATRGQHRIKELYGYEHQILPRINLLTSQMNKPLSHDAIRALEASKDHSPLISSSLYVDAGEGFLEDEKLISSESATRRGVARFSFKKFKKKNVSVIRWDPVEGECIRVYSLFASYVDAQGQEHELAVKSHNGVYNNGQYLFMDRDPGFVFTVDDIVTSVTVRYNASIIDYQSALGLVLLQFKQELEQKNTSFPRKVFRKMKRTLKH